MLLFVKSFIHSSELQITEVQLDICFEDYLHYLILSGTKLLTM